MDYSSGSAKKDFTHGGKACSSRAIRLPETGDWQIRAFVGSDPVGSPILISSETIADAKVQDPDNDLIAFAMDEVQRLVEDSSVPMTSPSSKA